LNVPAILAALFPLSVIAHDARASISSARGGIPSVPGFSAFRVAPLFSAFSPGARWFRRPQGGWPAALGFLLAAAALPGRMNITGNFGATACAALLPALRAGNSEPVPCFLAAAALAWLRRKGRKAP